MKDQDILKAIKKGVPLMVVEYRGFDADTMQWTNKATGRAMSAPIARHRVETESEGFVVTDFLPEGTKVEDAKSPYVKGQKLVLEIETMTKEKGTTRAKGILSPYESSEVKP